MLPLSLLVLRDVLLDLSLDSGPEDRLAQGL